MENIMEVLLNDCIQDHYGYLPEIFSLMIFSQIEYDQFMDCVELYFKAKSVFEHKTYLCFNINLEKFWFAGLIFFTENWEIVKSEEIFRELAYIYRHLNLEKISNDPKYFLPLARYLFIQSKFEESLEKAILSEKYLLNLEKNSKNMGKLCIERKISKVLALKIECYGKFQNQKMARIDFQKLKKYLIDENTINSWEKFVNEIPYERPEEEDLQRQRHSVLRRCGNSLCVKVETRRKEFKVCNRCKKIGYCSADCQRKDWKREHKKQCHPK